mgnify:CR=1 FL=1
MKRSTILLCLASATAGAWLALALAERSIVLSSMAQEPSASGRNTLVPTPDQSWRPSPMPSAALGAYGPPPTSLSPPPTPSSPSTLPGWDELTPEERVNVFVYQQANRSVVNINTRTVQSVGLLMLEVPAEGEGSGIVLDRFGHILTNSHVVDGAREIQVTLADSKSYEAKLIGIDAATDVAVLKINAPADSLVPIVFGNSNLLLVGQRVFAIGNPFGLERTLTTGIISSLNRSLPARKTGRSIRSIIQIDAAINPGNSGGPLLDCRGRMIGMNTAIASRTGESAGVGFAIPVNTLARVVPQLIERGKFIRPDSGIARVHQTDKGLLIASLVPGGAAERAGLQGPRVVKQKKRQGPFVYEVQTVDRSAADLITAVDGQPVRTGDDFLTAIEAKSPGDTVILTVIRDGQPRQVPLRLDAGE